MIYHPNIKPVKLDGDSTFEDAVKLPALKDGLEVILMIYNVQNGHYGSVKKTVLNNSANF